MKLESSNGMVKSSIANKDRPAFDSGPLVGLDDQGETAVELKDYFDLSRLGQREGPRNSVISRAYAVDLRY